MPAQPRQEQGSCALGGQHRMSWLLLPFSGPSDTMAICIAFLMVMISLIYVARAILRSFSSRVCKQPPARLPPKPRSLMLEAKGQVTVSHAASSSANPTDSNTGQPSGGAISPQHMFGSLDTRANPPSLDKNTSLFSELSQAVVGPQAASASLHRNSSTLLSGNPLASALRYLSAEGLATAAHVGDALTARACDMQHGQCRGQCDEEHEHCSHGGQGTPANAAHAPPMRLSEVPHVDALAGSALSGLLSVSDPTFSWSQASTSGRSDDATASLVNTSVRWSQRAVPGMPLEGEALARSQALLAKVRTTQYTSKLCSQRVKMCIKTRTTLGLDALPEGLGAQLQGALCSSAYPGYGTLDLSVRHGCILLTFDLMELGPPGSNPSTNCTSVLEAMLPVLAPLFTQKASTKAGMSTDEPLVHGQSYLLLQLGDEMVSVTWNSDGTWTATPYDMAGEAGAKAGGQWSLGPGRQVLAADGLCGMDAGNPVQLQVWCQLGHGNIQAYTAPPAITGWTPVPAGEHMDSFWEGLSSGRPAAAVAPPQLQVLARCQGGYVATTVTQLDAGQNGSVLLQVDLDRAHLDTLQLHHHVGGSPLGVLPLTLELWHGERWISASPVLLQLGPSAAPMSKVASLLSSCSAEGVAQRWWWGSRQAAVQAALQELLQQSETATWMEGLAAGGRLASADLDDPWTDADVANMVESHQQFLQDLTAWMNAVRQLALQGTGLCHGGCSPAGRHAATVLSKPAMTDEQLTELGAELYQHATAMGLTQIATMVHQQLHSVVGPATATAARAKHGSSGSGWLAAAARVWAALCVSVGGSSCEACERLYHARVSRQLAGVQVVSSTAFMIMGIAANITAIVGKQSWNNLAMAPWGLLHLAVCLERWIGNRTGKAATPSARPPPTCSWLCVAAYLCRVLVQVFMALCILTPLDAAREQFVRGDWMIATAVLSLGEQMQASAVIPAKLFMSLAAIEGLAVLCMYLLLAPHLAWAPLAPLLVVAPRLLLDMQLRALLRLKPPSPGTGLAAASSSGAKGKVE